MKRLPLFLALACGVLPVLQAEEGASVDRIREGEAKQQQLRGEAQRLVEQLDSMMDEYQRNQLGGEEIKTLQALRDSLAKLSVDEMKQVVDLLEKARGARDAGEAKQRVADAYTSQKAILAQMAKLLADHLRNEQSQEFAQQLAGLAERQAVNLQNGITLGQWSEGKKPDNLDAAKEANLQGQQAEQTAISEELKTLTHKVAEFSKDPENAEQARRLQKGLAAMQKVQPNVENAAAALKANQLFKAVGDEKTARDTMRQVAREIAPPPERSEALRAAQKELAKAIEDQKDLVKDAEKAAGERDFEHWLDEQQKLNPKLAKTPREQLRKDAGLQKRFEAQKNGQPEQLAEMQNKQGELAAKTDEVAQSLAKTAPEAARDVKAGTDKMQEARAAMADKNGPAAAKNAQEALAAMQTADAKLQQEMAKAEALAGKSGDPVKDLQALQQQAQALAQQQAAAAKNPDKSGQAALAQKAGELAKQAAAMAPAAAPAAQQAAAQAQQAAAQAQQAVQAAQAGQPAAAQAQQAAAAQAQQAAAQNLAQAAQQIAQQAAAAQQAQQQAAAAQQAQQQLAEIISAEQKLQIDTTKSAAVTPKGKTVKRDAFNGQAGRQEDIDGQTATFQKSLPQADPATNTALEAAQSAMSDAKKALEKLDGEAAKTAEAKAVEQLFAAQTGMQVAVAQAQQQAAAQAQQQMAQAQQQMAQQPNAQANAAAAQQAAAQQAAAQQAAAQQAAAQQAAAQQAAAQQAAAQQAAAQLAQAQAQIAQANQALQQAAQAAQPAAAQKAAQQAAAQLAKAAAQAGQAAAQAMPANAEAQQAIQAGAQAAAQGAAEAGAQNIPAAQAQAAAAGQALAQAQAALAQAQAGLTAANTPGAMPMPGSSGPPSGQPGQPGQPGQKPGQQPGKTPGKPGQMPGQPGTEAAQQYTPPGNETAKLEARTIMDKKSAAFTALPARERAVIEQSQSEKYPEEYGTQVEQYLLNLARESALKK